jgi:hypothetical protein
MEINYKKLLVRYLVGVCLFIAAHALIVVIIDQLKGKTLTQTKTEYKFPFIALLLVAGSIYVREKNQKEE